MVVSKQEHELMQMTKCSCSYEPPGLRGLLAWILLFDVTHNQGLLGSNICARFKMFTIIRLIALRIWMDFWNWDHETCNDFDQSSFMIVKSFSIQGFRTRIIQKEITLFLVTEMIRFFFIHFKQNI